MPMVYSSSLDPCAKASKMLFPMLVFLILGSVLPKMAAGIDIGTPQTSPAKTLPSAMLLLPTLAPAPTEPPKGRWGTMALFERTEDPSSPNLCGWVDGASKSMDLLGYAFVLY